MRIIQVGRRALCVLLALVSCSFYGQAASAQIININPVSATGSTNLQPASFAIDNIGNTRWESNHGVSPSSLTLDLGQPYALNQLVILWEAANAASYEILGSNNNSTWIQLNLLTGGTFGNRTDTVKKQSCGMAVKVKRLKMLIKHCLHHPNRMYCASSNPSNGYVR